MPRNLVEASNRQQALERWIASLPATVSRLEGRWSLKVGGPFQPGGQTAWVAATTDLEGRFLALKLAWRHPEAEHEADALRTWNGHGAVLLHVSEETDSTIALLLERCLPGTPLSYRPEPEQDTVIAELLRHLWITPPSGHRFRPLQAMCDMWADGFERRQKGRLAGLDPGITREALALLRQLPGTADRAVLLCTDLHAGNVLAAQREPWLVIDPKPYVGDPTYDSLQHLLNCQERLVADPHDLVYRMADLLDLDRERLLLWLFARCVQETPTWPALADVARRIAPT